MKKPYVSRPPTSKSIPVEQLINIGPTIAKRLREIGIRSKSDLQSVGSVNAYRRLRTKYPGKTIPVCYYLYSLEGALRDRHWDSLGGTVKSALRAQIDSSARVRKNKASHAD